MTNITQIIKYIDEYLIRNNQTDITPVDANKILAQAGLLSDSKDRPGLPLRKLLRDGKFSTHIKSATSGIFHTPITVRKEPQRSLHHILNQLW